MLLSVHFPKAAGTATAALLEQAFGTSLILSYEGDPANPTTPRNLDPYRFFRHPKAVAPGIRAVHGHFHPAQYTVPEDAMWVTLLRHPVDTMISIYWYWLATEPLGALHAYFKSQELTVEELARLPLLRNLMSQTYFGGVDMRRFSLIGRHDERDSALKRLSELVDQSLPADERRNETADQESLTEMLDDRRLRTRLQNLLAEDLAFYDTWAR